MLLCLQAIPRLIVNKILCAQHTTIKCERSINKFELFIIFIGAGSTALLLTITLPDFSLHLHHLLSNKLRLLNLSGEIIINRRRSISLPFDKETLSTLRMSSASLVFHWDALFGFSWKCSSLFEQKLKVSSKQHSSDFPWIMTTICWRKLSRRSCLFPDSRRNNVFMTFPS